MLWENHIDPSHVQIMLCDVSTYLMWWMSRIFHIVCFTCVCFPWLWLLWDLCFQLCCNSIVACWAYFCLLFFVVVSLRLIILSNSSQVSADWLRRVRRSVHRSVTAWNDKNKNDVSESPKLELRCNATLAQSPKLICAQSPKFEVQCNVWWFVPKVQQPCNKLVLCPYSTPACLQPCKDIMIIVKILSEQPASRT